MFCPRPVLCHSFCFVATMRWESSATCSCHHDILPHLRPQAIDSTDHGLKLLKSWAKIIHASFQMFLSGICHSNKSMANSTCPCSGHDSMIATSPLNGTEVPLTTWCSLKHLDIGTSQYPILSQPRLCNTLSLIHPTAWNLFFVYHLRDHISCDMLPDM
jgi:hypothetical protein